MTDPSPSDPELRDLEAKLVELAPFAAPAMSASQQRRLLYECAFAAGRKRSSAALWRWRIVAGVLVLAAAALARPTRHSPVVEREASPIATSESNEAAWSSMSDATILDGALTDREEVSARLDAWRVEPAPTTSLTDRLAELERADPHERSLAVGAMTRAAFMP
jgi:hypothetical protein